MNDPMLPVFGLSPVSGKTVVAKFDGGLLSSDGGVLVLREVEQLKSALDRLGRTRIRTNIKTGNEEITEGFGLIDSWRIVRQTSSGRMTELFVSLSDWVFNGVANHEVLTLHCDYFRLRSPLERRMYELARKHCGKQDVWSISLDLLRKKCGSASSDKEFRRLVQNIAQGDARYGHIPDYAVTVEGDKVRFLNRSTMPKAVPEAEKTLFPVLDAETYHDARTVAPGYDVYFLEQEWRAFWFDSGKPDLKNPDAAFIGFCKARYKRNPNP